jgi:GntR family transcriptional regulator
VRELAVALRINANTVARVYTHLERSGALETRRGVGTFVLDATDPSRNQAARDAELRAIATRALADASAHGFSAADLRRELQTISKGASS